MKILFISHEASRSGAPLSLLQLLRHIVGHCPHIHPEVLLMKDGPLSFSFRKICPVHQGWPQHTFKNRMLCRLDRSRAERPYLHLFRKGYFQCIYANTIMALPVGASLKSQLKIPLIVHVHEAAFLLSRCPFTPDFSMADHIVTVSRLAANDLIRYYDVLPTRISIQHPVSPWVADWLANPAGEVRDEASPIRIGMFSDGNWHKSTDILPLLLRHFFSSHPEVPCQFLLAGNIRKEVLLRLQYDLSQLHLSDKLQYIGCVENPQSLFSRLNIFLLPSREESFSLAAQEAACMKVPIVGFEGVTGATDFIRQGAGILVPYLDLEKMSDSLSRLATDSKLRETVGQCGRQIVEDMYQRDSQMDVILSVIQRTIIPLTSL